MGLVVVVVLLLPSLLLPSLLPLRLVVVVVVLLLPLLMLVLAAAVVGTSARRSESSAACTDQASFTLGKAARLVHRACMYVHVCVIHYVRRIRYVLARHHTHIYMYTYPATAAGDGATVDSVTKLGES